jgi:Fur family ferric uptake transcriptional regulator
MQIKTTEGLLAEYLKRRGQHFSGADRTVVRAFIGASEPISILDLAFSVKRLDPLVSLGTVRRYLKLLTEAGLATANQAVELSGRGPMLFELVPDPKPDSGGCVHRHLVCKDCGTIIDIENRRTAGREG